MAFTATRSKILKNATKMISFDSVTVNDGNAFSLKKNTFVAPITSLYWFHISIGIPSNTWANVRLIGCDRPLDIIRQNTSFKDTPMTTSRDGIMLLKEGTQLWLSSDYALYSDHYLQTSFSAFAITSIMDDPIAFSVAMSKSIYYQVGIKIPYDVVNIDTANAWNASNKEYVAPLNGIYVVSVSTAAYPENNHIMQISINNNFLLIASVYITDANHSGLDIISRTVIAHLNKGDRLYTQFDAWNGLAYSLYSDDRHQTTLQGYFYSSCCIDPIAWFAGKFRNGDVTGEVFPFVFDKILINEGKGFNLMTNTFVVPLAGVYYIHLTTGTRRARSKLVLMRNGLPAMNVHVESNDLIYLTSSRAIILQLELYDELRIRLPYGYSAFSNSNQYVTFSGFRIY